ncbi:unnamed protein product [Eruca vesicaria subsp. sativa]|uniref:ABC transporter domain-containing protein n=1 Tax=Eruca vesicaria subsp. sativa TaxID=29727 RepID=A0ABC8KRB1_ERUVS|nr:unnamed protein product [Eruca vesicaria subsp. sativa]
MELLYQMDGHDQNVNFKVIMANQQGRHPSSCPLMSLGDLIVKLSSSFLIDVKRALFSRFVPVSILLTVFSLCTSKMNLGEEVDLEDYVPRPDKISAAERLVDGQDIKEVRLDSLRSSIGVVPQDTLSGGEKQRMALARAFLKSPATLTAQQSQRYLPHSKQWRVTGHPSSLPTG